MHVLVETLQGRWQQMFQALSNGEDLPPGRRLRAEGIAEAAVLVGAASEAELDREMGSAYKAAFDRTLAEQFGEDWRSFFPFPEIPAVSSRAPVYPSTAD